MYKQKAKNGRECEVYETFDEVLSIAFNPPQYCERDGTELKYFSFYDGLSRFTLKAYCPTCQRKWAVTLNEENYEKKMLSNWTEMVKERAGNRCEMADEHCNGPLHAHHMIPKHLDPGKKFDVENGICLCEAHHKMIHRYM